jgi:hypothetical protein
MNYTNLLSKAIDQKAIPALCNVLVRPAHDHVTLTALATKNSWGAMSVTIPCQPQRNAPYAVSLDDLKHHAKTKSRDPFAAITPVGKKDTDELIRVIGEAASTPFPPTAHPYPVTAMLEAEHSISTDTTRYVLNGTCLEGDHIIATNGRCLYVSQGHQTIHDKPLIVPDSKLIRAFHRSVKGEAFIQVTERNGQKFLRLRGGNMTLVVRAVDGNYPEWRKVMPKPALVNVQFNPQHVIEALDSLPFHLLRDEQFHFRIRKGVSQIVLIDPEGREHARNIFCIADGTSDISFNAEFVRPYLKAGFNTLDVLDDLSPGLFTKTDHPHNAQLVLMPMRTAQPAQAKAA